jgi:peptidoglycan/LPS O-acetylase OafA/YrhL
MVVLRRSTMAHPTRSLGRPSPGRLSPGRLSPGRLNRATSVYLDTVRVFAVLLVFLSHAKRPGLGGNSVLLDTLGQYGQGGVAFFFVISGLVIAHVAATRESTLGTFAVARLSRLWSVVLPAIVLTIVLDSIGRAVDPQLYADPIIPAWHFDLASLWQAVAPALFLNQVPGLHVEVGTNGPFWSLCNEGLYYLGFACVVLVRAPLWIRLALLLVLAVFAGAPIVILAPIWIAGNLLYRALGRASPSPVAWIVWLGTTLAIPLSMLLEFRITHVLSASPLGLSQDSASMVAESFVPAGLFVANLISFDAISSRFATILQAIRPIVRMLVDRSFSIYLYQAPLFFFFGALTHNVMPRRLGFALVCTGTLVACALLAEVTEGQRKRLAGWLTLMSGFLSGLYSHPGAPQRTPSEPITMPYRPQILPPAQILPPE